MSNPAYSEFAQECNYCFACKVQPLPIEFERGMFRRLEIAHLIGGAARIADRRAVNRLCKAHHMLQEGETLRYNGKPLPKLTLANMLYLKQRFDKDFYCVEFIRELRRKKNGIIMVPEPEQLEVIEIGGGVNF